MSMARLFRICTPVFLIALIALWANSAAGQSLSAPGGRVFGLVGGSFGNGDTASLVSGGAGLRLTRHLGLDVEVLHAHGLDFSDRRLLIERGLPEILIFPPFEFTHEGNITALLTRMTAEFPVANDRLIPFVTGGGGVGRMAERIAFSCTGVCPAIFFPDLEQAEAGLALTLGGGVDVRLWQGLAVGGEVRWLRVLLSERDLDFAHVAARVSYRF